MNVEEWIEEGLKSRSGIKHERPSISNDKPGKGANRIFSAFDDKGSCRSIAEIKYNK